MPYMTIMTSFFMTFMTCVLVKNGANKLFWAILTGRQR